MPTQESQRQYTNVNLTSVLEALPELVLALKQIEAPESAEMPVHASCELFDQPGTTIRFFNLAEMSAELLARGRSWMSIGDWGSEKCRVVIERRELDGPLQIRTEAPISLSDACNVAVDRFASAAGLTLVATREARLTEITLRRRFLGPALDADQLLALCRQHLLVLLPVASFPVRVVLRDQTDREVSYAGLDSLPNPLPEQLEQLMFSASSTDAGVRWLDFDVSQREATEVRVRCSFVDGQEPIIEAALEAFGTSAGLTRVAEVQAIRPGHRGRGAYFFTAERMNFVWFESFAEALRRAVDDDRTTHGFLEFRNRVDKVILTSLEELLAKAKECWDDLVLADLQLFGSSRYVRVGLELKLDLVHLEIIDANEEAAEARLEEIARASRLQECRDRPYGPPTASRSYRLNFNRSKFADVIDRTLRLHTDNDDPLLTPAQNFLLIEDIHGTRSFERFNRLQPLLDRLKSDANIIECHIVAKGPRDRVISLHVEKGLETLHIQARLEAGAFTDFIRQIEKELRLQRSDADARREETEGFWPMLRQNKGLPGVLMGALVGAVITAAGFVGTRMIAKDKIEFRHPVRANGEPAATASEGCVKIEWEVVENRLFDDGRSLVNETGDLSVTSQSGEVLDVEDFRSGDGFYLPRGRWTVDVYDRKRQRASPVLQVIVSPPASGVDAPEREPGPCP